MSSEFRRRLASLRAACVPFYGLGADTFHPVKIRPSLGFAMVPRPRERPEPEPSPEIGEALALGKPLWTMADPGGAAAGLVDGAKFDATPAAPGRRQGLAGLSAAGKIKIEDLCALTQGDRAVYGIWTVTLPIEAACDLDAMPDGAQRFGDAIRRRFGEALRRACQAESERLGWQVPDHWWFVAEPQKSGVPHWHFVFRSKARRGRRWLLGKGRLDRLICNAFRTVTGTAYPVKAAGNVQALRKNPGAYLGKYLSKTAEENTANWILQHGWTENLIPHRWWGCSRSAHAFQQEHTFPLPALACHWLSRQWKGLAGIGALVAGIWQPPAEGAPAIVCGKFRGIDGLEQVLSHLFDLAERAYPTGRTFGTT